jgi:transposase
MRRADDAKRLVRSFAAGELSYAFVPSEADERFRDLVRGIEDARKDLMRSRHRLSKFLLRRGHQFPSKAWTQPHERWLGKLRFEDAPSQATFVDYLCAVQTLVGRRRTLIEVLEQTVPETSHAQTVARLRCFRGIDTLTAAGLCAEVGDFHRFAKPALRSGSLGVVASEYTSDQKRTQRQITKAGPPHARRLWVEAAHHYRHQPAVRLELKARQAGQDPRGRAGRLALPAPSARALEASRGHPRQAHRHRRRSPAHASSPRSAGRPRPWTNTIERDGFGREQGRATVPSWRKLRLIAEHSRPLRNGAAPRYSSSRSRL